MRLAALASALLLVLAGCGGVMTAPITETSDGTDSPTATPSTDVSVIGGDLPVDADRVFERVLNLTGERISGPVVYIEDAGAGSADQLNVGQRSFRTALGVAPPNDSARPQPIASAPSDGNSVSLYERARRNETSVESTLAHEFAHVVQFRSGWNDPIWTVDQDVGKGEISYDRQLTYYLVLEGAAEYVQGHYEERFLPGRSDQLPQQLAAYENAAAHERLSYAPYALGAEYVTERVDSPRDLAGVHLYPPSSSEQVLHNTTDPVEDVTVTTGETGDWAVESRDRQGELFVRVALRTELNRSTAVDAAAGWGEDRRVSFTRNNATGTAWVLHWDDRSNATEFETAFRAYLDAKATERSGVWYENAGSATYRLERTANESTVVLLGNETFVRSVTVNGTDEDAVAIEIEE